MEVGTVKWYNEKKGFGFIAAEDGRDIFVHYSALEGEGRTRLQEGDIVEYEEVQGERGPKAAKVICKKNANP
ncbi:cold-shock protein [Planctomycetota bacterium]